MKASFILGTRDDVTANGFRPLIEMARTADAIGIDLVTVPEHLAMSENNAEFVKRYGANPPVDTTTKFVEPMVFMGALSTVTKTIRLGTSIILTPLRPALVMAKQMAVLDYISGGRTIFGLGAGWQKEEFDATNMPWEGRHQHLFEQIECFHALWSQAPASYHGRFINFDGLNSLPFPAQGKNIPLLLGIVPTDRNVRRMAELGAGWMPMPTPLKDLAAPIRKIKDQYRAAGRAETDLEVMTFIMPEMGPNGQPDLDRTLARIPEYAEVGGTIMQFSPDMFAANNGGFAAVLERINRAVKG